MKYAEYLELHYSFYNTIILQLGLQCPLRCKHCSVFAGPRRKEVMSAELMRSVIKDFGDGDSSKLVVLTGGEPFALGNLLPTALSEIDKYPQLQTLVITAAPWAHSAEHAVEVLESMPAISLLAVSADVYHEEFVPLSFVANAVRAAHRLGRDVAVTIGVGFDGDPYIGRVRAAVGESVWHEIEVDVVRVMPTGRAKAAGIGSFETTPQPLPQGACDLLGTPVVIHDGTAVACCQIDATNEASRTPGSEYVLGNMHSSTYHQLRQKVEENILFQALRVWGPAELVRMLRTAGHAVPLKAEYDGICFLCRDLLTNPAATAALKHLLSTHDLRREIHVSRMLQYGELRPCPAAV